MKIFLICPIRNANKEQIEALKIYVKGLKTCGNDVYYPGDDTVQTGDPTGFRICKDNKEAIRNADEVHVFFDPTSYGSHFDLGMAFAMNKTLVVVNTEDLPKTDGKCFINMISEWEKTAI